MSHTGTSRRGFLASVTAGLGVTSGMVALPAATGSSVKQSRLPREVWVASITLGDFEPKTYQENIRLILKRMTEVTPYRPDIICLPEVAPFMKLKHRPPLSEVAEEPLGPISSHFAAFAKAHQCYVIIPLYTKENGHYYNAAVLIDRKGNYVGQYRKMFPTVGEMNSGITPGPTDPPVFKTDFGVIGIQICFDLQFFEGFQRLGQKGAEIVFWPSAYCGGKALNAVAWMNQFVVVASTRYDPTKMCDIDGNDIATSAYRSRHWICEPINLEKTMIKKWPHIKKYDAIIRKYGRKIHLKILEDEVWTVMESLSPDVRVVDVLKEFDIESFRAQNEKAAEMHKSRRIHS